MSDTTSELLRAFVDASEERKGLALQVLKGEVTTCPHLKQGRTVIGDGRQVVEQSVLMGMGAASKYMGVSRSTLWRVLKQGTMGKVELFPGSYRVRRADIDALVARNCVGPSGSRRGRPRRVQPANVG